MISVLSKGNQDKAVQFQTAIQGIFWTVAPVSSSFQVTQIEIKDLNEVTMDQEIFQELIMATENREIVTKAINSPRNAYFVTQCAVVIKMG